MGNNFNYQKLIRQIINIISQNSLSMILKQYFDGITNRFQSINFQLYPKTYNFLPPLDLLPATNINYHSHTTTYINYHSNLFYHLQLTHHLLNCYQSMLQKTKKFFSQHKYKILAGSTFALAAYAFLKYYNNQNHIRFSAFLQALQANQLDEVVVTSDTVHFKSALSDWYHSSLGTYPVAMLFQDLKKSPNLKFTSQNQNILPQILLSLGLAFGSTAIIAYLLMPQKFATLNKRPQIIKNHQTFTNFYGSEEIKLKLKEIIDFLKNKEKFKKFGGRVRRGILLHGPPGTGKTMLAKTLANEADLPFIETCAAEFQQIYVGVGPKKIRQIFKIAKKCRQGCIVFIDELDAIGTRSQGMRFSRQTTATINQLLTELDGFEQNQNVVVVAATNRIDLVDRALIRAGRFDIKVRLELPNKNERLGILKTLLVKKNVPNKISQEAINKIAQKSINWSGADIEALINEGVYRSIRVNSQFIQDGHILSAFEEMIEN